MKKLLLGLALVFVANVTVAAVSVMINKVETANPWDGAKGTIRVDYSLGGLDSRYEYCVAFDVTAKNETRGVTNAAAKLTDGTATKAIDTAALFGREIVDKDAEITISLIKMIPAGQLWEDGPIWADVNLGISEVDGHPEYGALYKFDEADAAVKSLLGQEWRVPSKDDFDDLINMEICTQEWDDTRIGWTFTGKGAYSSNSIFLPSAGYDAFYNGSGRDHPGELGYYWSSSKMDSYTPWSLFFVVRNVFMDYYGSFDDGMSVRAVRDDPEGGEKVVAYAKTAFWLGPGCESCPWTVGESVTAYMNGIGGLVITGSGEMSDFASAAEVPWAAVADQVTAVTVDEGVTKIGKNALAGFADTVMVNGTPLSFVKAVALSLGFVKPPPVPPVGAVATWDALTNAIVTAASGAVIAVGADITEEGGELVVPKGKAVTIKLYGKTVSCGLVTVGGALTVGDAEDAVGKIVATEGAKVVSSGSVTLLGGPMRGTFTARSHGLVMLFH